MPHSALELTGKTFARGFLSAGNGRKVEFAARRTIPISISSGNNPIADAGVLICPTDGLSSLPKLESMPKAGFIGLVEITTDPVTDQCARSSADQRCDSPVFAVGHTIGDNGARDSTERGGYSAAITTAGLDPIVELPLVARMTDVPLLSTLLRAPAVGWCMRWRVGDSRQRQRDDRCRKNSRCSS